MLWSRHRPNSEPPSCPSLRAAATEAGGIKTRSSCSSSDPSVSHGSRGEHGRWGLCHPHVTRGTDTRGPPQPQHRLRLPGKAPLRRAGGSCSQGHAAPHHLAASPPSTQPASLLTATRPAAATATSPHVLLPRPLLAAPPPRKPPPVQAGQQDPEAAAPPPAPERAVTLLTLHHAGQRPARGASTLGTPPTLHPTPHVHISLDSTVQRQAPPHMRHDAHPDAHPPAEEA